MGILDGQALPDRRSAAQAGVYDYQSKYTPGATEYLCAQRLSMRRPPRRIQARLRRFQSHRRADYARVDVMVRPNGEPVVLEVNTLPGMTETSLLPKAAAAAGIGYARVVPAHGRSGSETPLQE